MENLETKKLVGKSFEELSIDEMNTLQGASSEISPNSASILVSITATVGSAALSGQLSKAVSTLITAYKKCA